MSAGQTVRVGVSVVEHQGRYLVGIRAADADLPGKAEFPGGKCEPGEVPRDAAARECLEETGLAVEPIKLLLQREFSYEHARVELHFWLCRTSENIDDPQNGFQWLSVSELKHENFPAANDEILELISNRSPLLGEET